MNKGLMRKIAPLIIGIPLVFGSCQHRPGDVISQEPIYRDGVIISDVLSREIVKTTETVSRSGSGVVKEVSETRDKNPDYFINLISNDEKWVIDVVSSLTPDTRMNHDQIVKSVNSEIGDFYKKIKVGRKIRFPIGDTYYSTDEKGPQKHFNYSKNIATGINTLVLPIRDLQVSDFDFSQYYQH